MRAAVLREPGTPLRIENVDLADPRAGEVLVRVLAAGVCHSDLHYMTGDLQSKLPVVLGHEGAGIVEAVGPGVDRFRPGDRVITLWRPRCGDCRHCSTGRPALCALGRITASTGGLLDGTSRLQADGEKVHHLMGVSCFAERCVVSERSLVKIDDDIPPEIAAITGCAVVTGAGAVLNVMDAAAGEGVVVIGAGGVGLSAVLALNLIGAAPVVVVDTVDERLAKARELGATHTVNPTRTDLADELARVSRRPFDWALDAVGSPQTLRQAVDVVGVRGTVVAVGLGKAGATAEIPVNALVQQEKRIVGSLYGSANTPVDIPRLLDLYREGLLPLDRLVGDRYQLAQIDAAYSSLAAGAVGRAVVLPTG